MQVPDFDELGRCAVRQSGHDHLADPSSLDDRYRRTRYRYVTTMLRISACDQRQLSEARTYSAPHFDQMNASHRQDDCRAHVAGSCRMLRSMGFVCANKEPCHRSKFTARAPLRLVLQRLLTSSLCWPCPVELCAQLGPFSI